MQPLRVLKAQYMVDIENRLILLFTWRLDMQLVAMKQQNRELVPTGRVTSRNFDHHLDEGHVLDSVRGELVTVSLQHPICEDQPYGCLICTPTESGSTENFNITINNLLKTNDLKQWANLQSLETFLRSSPWAASLSSSSSPLQCYTSQWSSSLPWFRAHKLDRFCPFLFNHPVCVQSFYGFFTMLSHLFEMGGVADNSSSAKVKAKCLLYF